MIREVLSRSAQAIFALGIALLVSFVLVRLSGDPARSVAGPDAPESAVEAIREDLGLDASLPQQLANYVTGFLRGDLGDSLRFGVSNDVLILPALVESVRLALSALAVAALAGVLLGVLAAVRRNGAIDRIISITAMLTQATPAFWVGLVLILVFSVQLGLLPSGGSEGGFKAMVLPMITMSLFPFGQIARITRESVARALEEEYVTALRSRGVPGRSIYIKHALKNAALPIVTIVGLMGGILISLGVTIEYVFAWPGLGLLTVQAIEFRDLTLVQSIVVVGAAIYILINLAIDLLYLVLDPRTRRPT